MNVGDLRKIIYEEVVKAMREEFREILVEAVQSIENQTLKEDYRTVTRIADIVQEETKPKTISNLLEETAKNMSREDYKALMDNQHSSGSAVIPGMPDFISKAVASAKNVLDASNRRDLERHGI